MKTPYRISEKDYYEAVKLYAKPSLLQGMIYSCVFLSLLAIIAFGSSQFKQQATAILIGLLFMVLIVRFVSLPIMARRHYRKYKAIQVEFFIDWNDDGVFLSSSTGEGKIVWANLLKWRQNRNYILLYMMPRLYYIVPKSVKERGFDLDGFTRTLQEKLGHQS